MALRSTVARVSSWMLLGVCLVFICFAIGTTVRDHPAALLNPLPDPHTNLIDGLLKRTSQGGRYHLKWLAVGDSITQALAPAAHRRRKVSKVHPDEGTCSYLSYLQNNWLNRTGAPLSFLGPFHEAAAGPYSASCPKPDPYHAATWGITAREVAARFVTTLPRNGPHIEDVIKKRPDIVSFLIGTNDIATGAAPTKVLDYLRSMVQAVFQVTNQTVLNDSAKVDLICRPVVVLLALLPRRETILQTAVSSFNRLLLSKAVPWLNHPCVIVISVDRDLDAADTTLFYDGLHPTNSGSQILARNIVTELSRIPL